jgi:hypothetical protein
MPIIMDMMTYTRTGATEVTKGSEREDVSKDGMAWGGMTWDGVRGTAIAQEVVGV